MKPIRYGSLDEFLEAWQQDALKAVQPPVVRAPLPAVPKPEDAKGSQ